MAAKGVSTTSELLESSDYYALVEHLEQDGKYRWALFCIIACTMGLRVSDMKRIHWQDILAGDLHFIDEKKTGKNRRIKINCSVRRESLEYYDRMERPPLEQLIFLASAPNGPTPRRTSTPTCGISRRNTCCPQNGSRRIPAQNLRQEDLRGQRPDGIQPNARKQSIQPQVSPDLFPEIP